MNFRVDFGAEDNPKDTENSTFEASSLLVVKAKFTFILQFMFFSKKCFLFLQIVI